MIALRGTHRWFHGVKRFFHYYKRNRMAVAGLIVISIISLMAALAPLISPNPFGISNNIFQPPSIEFLFGTDDLGRSTFGGVLYGARVSLLIGILSVCMATILGVTIGAVSGYYGGKPDMFLMRIIELFQSIPVFFLALILVSLFGPSTLNIIVVIGLLYSPSTARLVRAEFLSLKERDFVLGLKGMGVGDLSIVFGEILPNASISIVVNTSLLISRAILLESGLSFLGLTDPGLMSWGYLLGHARLFMRQSWWLMLFPGLALTLTTLGFNFIADGVNEALNPKLREI